MSRHLLGKTRKLYCSIHSAAEKQYAQLGGGSCCERWLPAVGNAKAAAAAAHISEYIFWIYATTRAICLPNSIKYY